MAGTLILGSFESIVISDVGKTGENISKMVLWFESIVISDVGKT